MGVAWEAGLFYHTERRGTLKGTEHSKAWNTQNHRTLKGIELPKALNGTLKSIEHTKACNTQRPRRMIKLIVLGGGKERSRCCMDMEA